MYIIHGPTWQYQGQRLQQPTTIVVQDHHDSEHGYELQKLLDASVCDLSQHLLVFDHVNKQDEFVQVPHVCLPLLLVTETQEFNRENIQTAWQPRTQAFNFMINKPRPNRQILLDMIQDLGLVSYKHSLAWQHNFGAIPCTDYRFGDEIRLERGTLNGSHTNASTYHCLLKSAVFEGTCVSLITEPCYHGRETMITEKTLMAIWAGTVPIWVGGWRCADFMKRMGFDVFDDVIDHGYQAFSDPAERCRQAILRNQAILRQPIPMAQYALRLIRNLNLLRKNVWLESLRLTLQTHPELMNLVVMYRAGSLPISSHCITSVPGPRT